MENSARIYNSGYILAHQWGGEGLVNFISDANEFYIWIRDEILIIKISLFLRYRISELIGKLTLYALYFSGFAVFNII